MENKQVLTNLLQEQKEFLNEVTSYQIEGISQESMDNTTNEDKNSIRNVLMKCTGIIAVERTYHTEKRGQWLLVIKQNQYQVVTQYINKNIEQLYKKRNDKTNKLITYTLDTNKTAYRLKLTPTYTGKVGTYAEVLKRRFDQKQFFNTNSYRPNGTNIINSMETPQKIGDDAKICTTNTTDQDSLNQTKTSINNTNNNHPKLSNRTNENRINVNEENKGNPKTIQEALENEKKNSVSLRNEIDKLKEANNKMLESIHQKLEQKLEKMLEKRIMEVSVVVANTVAGKLTNAIQGILQRNLMPMPSTKQHYIENSKSNPKYISPIKNRKINGDTSATGKEITTEKSTGIRNILNEIQHIDPTSEKIIDPPHDNKIGSVSRVT